MCPLTVEPMPSGLDPTTGDNCGNATIVGNFNSGQLFPVGTTEVIYVATDSSGNTDTCSFNITVNDTEDPVITNCPSDITVNNDPGQCGANVSWTQPVPSDNCPGVVMTASHTPGDFFGVDSTEVVYIATDAVGNTDTCSFYVIVIDNEAPVLDSCPSNITMDNDSGFCSAVVTWSGPTASDNCQLDTLMGTHMSGMTFPVGTTTVTYTATDTAGNADSCSFDVTVNDVENPIAVCPANITVSNDSGVCGAVVNFTLPGSVDNCGIASEVTDFASGALFPIGTTVVTLTATDSTGNSDTCTFDISVNDTEAPTLSACPGNMTVSNDAGQCGAQVGWTPPTAGDNCPGFTVSSTHAPGDTFSVGTTTVTYTVTDASGNSDSCSFDVTVNDTEAPMAMCPAPITVSNDSGQCGANVTFTLSATDNCGIASEVSSANSGDFFAVGTSTVSYTVTDSSGNVDSCSFTITVNDTEAPVVVCPANITMDNDSGQCGAVVTFTLSASDNCGIASDSSTANSGDFFNVGTTTVMYMATDSAGNMSSCSFDVTVNDTEAPVAICPANITVNNDSGQCGANVTFTLSGTDNCGIASDSATANSGDFFSVGTGGVGYIVTDSSGNADTCIFTITVIDNEAPVATCPANITVDNDSAKCSAAVSFTLSGTDNCGIASEVSSANSGDDFVVGTTTVNYTVTDSSGNTDSCSFTITVNDTEAPVVFCPANITQGNDAGQCGAAVTFSLAASDNCGVASDSSSANSGDFFPVGTTTVSYMATDSAGNTSSCSFDITVNDTEAPVANCPAPIAVSNDSGQCGANVTFTLSATDNCGIASETSSHNSGDFFSVGTTTVSYLVTDSAGNVDSCDFDITVNDNEAPVAVCPAPITVSNDSGQCGANVSFTLNASDNCGIASETSSHNSGDFFAVGTTTVSYMVTDSSGNTDSCAFDITVNDTEAPVVNCPANITVSNSSVLCGANVNFSVSSSDNCGVVSDSLSHNSGDFFPVGTTTVSYSATDGAGNTGTCSFDITVNDTTSPIVTCPGPITVNNDSGQCGAVVNYSGLNATDNCGVDTSFTSPADGSFFSVGTTTVVFTALDSSGNSDTCQFSVTVIDNEAPVVSCPANITVANDSGQCGAVVSFTINSSDNCGIASDSSSHNSGDFFSVGTTTVTYMATDSAGNMSSCSFDVTVNDTEAPMAMCPANITVSNDSGMCSAVVTYIGTANDNCGIASETFSPASGSTFAVGTTTVSYTVTDSSGNSDSCSFTVTVNDTEAPMVMCPANITVSNDSGMCSAVVTYMGTASDNCGIASETYSPASGSTFAVGTSTVTYTVVDSAGNSDSCSFTVTVNDTEAPVAVCPAPITVSNDSGMCSAVVTFSGSSSDNCGVASAVFSPASGSTFAVGTTSVTYSVTDSAGNVDSCMFDVTVNDTEAPMAMCPAPITVSNDSGQCGAAVNFTLSNSDNCGVASAVSSANSGDFFAVGTTTVSYVVTDSSGNVDSCSFDITVNDTEAPMAMCPAPITVSNDSGQCSAVVTYTGTANDNCGIASETFSPASGSTFAVGTSTVTYTVVDSAGNSDSCSFTVTVNDTEAPVAVCPAPVTVSNDSGMCSAVVTFSGSSSDNCGVASAVFSPASGSTFAVGTTSVTYTVTDSAGNVDSCMFDVTVNDTEAPMVMCPANITMANDSGQCGAIVTFTLSSSDNCGIAADSSSHNSGDFFAVGTTTVTYMATDSSGNMSSCSFDITVNDTEAPMAMCPAPITVSNDSGLCSAVVTFTGTANDNCGVASEVYSPASGSSFAVGTTTVTYTVTDSAGNSDSCTFDVTVDDNEAPMAMCPAPITVSNDSGQCGANVSFTLNSSDNCGIAADSSSHNSGDFFAVGTTTVSYMVTDSSGNVDSCSFDITVNDNEAPVAVCPGPIAVDSDSSLCGAAVTFTVSASDNCGVASATPSVNSGDFFGVGTTTVTYVVVDSSNNIDTCQFSVTVTDTEPPMAICPAPITVSNDTGQCGANVTFTVQALDNCGIGADTISHPSGGFFPVGVTSVTYIVADSAGNADTCSFDVTVNDTEAPVAVCPTPITVSNDSGQCGAVVAFTLAGSDNCGIAADSASAVSGSFFAVGTTTVSYMVTDSSGNTDNCSFDITVNDDENPAITCPANVVVGNDLGFCGATVSFNPATATDNCTANPTVTQTVGQTPGSFFQVGSTIITYEATDSAGNTDDCSFLVIVNDVQAPDLTCPAPITVNNDTGLCGAVVTWTAPVGTDQCPGQVVTAQTDSSGLSSGDLFPVGTTTIEYTATDTTGNDSMCSFTVTVIDNEAPSITCPAPISVNSDSGQCSAAVSVPAPTAGDNCTPVVLANSFTGGANASGTYPVGTTTVIYTAVDTFGNSDTCSFTVTVTDNELPMISCPGNVTVTADSVTCSAPASWAAPTTSDNCGVDSVWSTDSSGTVFSVGTHTVTYFITDVNGNLDSCSFTVTVNPQTFVISLGQSVYNCGHGISCNGETDGSVDVALFGGCEPYSISWSTGDTTPGVDSLGAGTYVVTVSDGNGTVLVDSVTLTEPDSLMLTTQSDSLVCFGDSTGTIDLTVTGGNDCQAYSYAWSNGDTTEDLSGLAPGLYEVTVTDVSGCMAMTSVQIISLPLPPVDLGADTSVCDFLALTLDAGSGFVDYNWNTGDTTQTIIVANPGTYAVTITDIFGCTNDDSIAIGQFVVADSFITPREDLLICRQDTLILDAGPGFNGFSWSTGDTTQAITVAGFGGPISVVAIDTNGCSATDSVFVDFNDVNNPVPVIAPGPDVNLCDGSTDTLDVLDGYFSYTWNTGDTTQSIPVSTSGQFVVTVTNGFGCIGVSDTVTVTSVANPMPSINFNNDSLFTDPGYVSYQWNLGAGLIPGAIFEAYEPLQSGSYTVAVIDTNGCEGVSDSLFVNIVSSAEAAPDDLFGITLYPNPTSGIIFVKSLEPINWDVDITVMDMYGHLVKTFHVGQLVDAKQLDLTDVANGMYILKVEDKKGRAAMLRFMIE